MKFTNDTPLSFDDTTLSAEEFVELMFQRTDLDQIVYIPGWHYDWAGWEWGAAGSTDEYNSYRCGMDWTMVDMERIIARFQKLYAALEKIAPHFSDVSAISDPELQAVWHKYLAPLDIGNLSPEKLRDIDDRLGTQLWIQKIASNFSKGVALEDFEKSALIEYMEVSVSPEEKACYEQYKKNLYKDAERRVGGKICAFDVIFRARRVCRLLQLKAPFIVIQNEARILAAAMALNAFGLFRESVDNSTRQWREQMDLMNDDELDALGAPKKTNSVKSLVPVFVMKILKEETNSSLHMRQVDLLEALKKYEIFIERKALNRAVHTLADSQLPIMQDYTGVWYEQ